MIVYALVGSTGTGKSYRAPHIAQRYGITCIIDDGLLICEGRIVAGRSAKAEMSKIKAAKVAVFYYPEHREKVTVALAEAKPERMIVLGISCQMVETICRRLNLPLPSEWIDIDRIASVQDIELARLARENEGKHTIPVPLIELKRNLWGNLVDTVPVKVWGWFYSSKEKTVVRPPFSYLGKLTVSEIALRSLVWILLTNLSRVEAVNDIVIHKQDTGVYVRIMCVLWGHPNLSRSCRYIQKFLRQRVEDLSGVELKRVDIDVDGIVPVPEPVIAAMVKT
ncbi:MAG TPA: hypothetical protein VLH40_03495 [Atribacteraceae bacterium]|nr:hypothetical protein [Atribacteraceae bacterium]